MDIVAGDRWGGGGCDILGRIYDDEDPDVWVRQLVTRNARGDVTVVHERADANAADAFRMRAWVAAAHGL